MSGKIGFVSDGNAGIFKLILGGNDGKLKSKFGGKGKLILLKILSKDGIGLSAQMIMIIFH